MILRWLLCASLLVACARTSETRPGEKVSSGASSAVSSASSGDTRIGVEAGTVASDPVLKALPMPNKYPEIPRRD